MANDDDVISGILAAPDVGDDIISGILSAPDDVDAGPAAGASSATDGAHVILTTPDGQQQRRFARVETEKEFTPTSIFDFFDEEKRFAFAAEAGKFTQEGKASFLQEKLGRQSIYTDDKGQIYVVPPSEQGKPLSEQVPQILNREGLSPADMALIPAMVSGTAAGVLAAPAAAVAGGAKGLGVLAATGAGHAAARQAASMLMPGDDDATVGERLADLGLSAGSEVLLPVVGVAARAGRSAIAAPVQRVVGAIAGRNPLAKRAIQEGVELGERTGIDFTTAALAQVPGLQRAERFIRQQPGAGVLAQAVERSVGQLESYANRIAEAMNRRVVDAGDVAQQLMDKFGAKLSAVGKDADSLVGLVGRESAATGAISRFTTRLQGLDEHRRATAQKLFGKVAQITGQKKVMPVRNALDEINQLMQEMRSDLSTDTARKTVKFLEKSRSRLLRAAGKRKEPMVSMASFQNSLSDWSRKSMSPEGVIEGVMDRGLGSMVATRMANALRRDLDAGVALEGPGSQALKAARDAYAAQSAAIREMTNSPIAKLVDTPEKLITRLMSKDRSGENRAMLQLLERIAPAQAREVRSAAISDALSSVKVMDNGFMEPRGLANAIDKKLPQLRVLLESDPATMKRLMNIRTSARKLQGNPLLKMMGDTEELTKVFRKQGSSRELRAVMSFAREADPQLAEDIGSAFMQDLVGRIAPRGTDLVTRTFNPTAMANMVNRNWGAIKTAVGNNKAAISAVADLEKASRRLASIGIDGSQTQSFQALQKVLGGFGVGFSVGAGSAVAGLGTALAGMFTMNRVASAFANPAAVKAYAQAMRGLANPEEVAKSPFLKEQVTQAINDIVTWNARMDESLREDLAGTSQQRQ